MADATTRPDGPVDSDVDLRMPEQRRELTGARALVLGVIAAGGAAGALARYGLAAAFPHRPTGFPWATFVTNVSGCLLIGILMVVIDRFGAHRLARPFLGVGVLGGFTTFSTHIVEFQQAVAAGAARLALTYLAATLLAAAAAVWAGSALAERLTRQSRRR
jgi:CrcB protein